MRAVVASLFVATGLLGLPWPAPASPPDDIAAYCRALHPQVPLQVRCLSLENGAAARVGRAGPGSDPDAWNRCRGTAASWSAMEQCLSESARAAAVGGAGGGGGGAAGPTERPAAVATPDPSRPGPGVTPPTAPPADPAPPATPPTAVAPPPSSTVILGPQSSPTPASERARQTRPISEEDAERQLRSVLERNPAARCSKKQYGPGWVITCQ